MLTPEKLAKLPKWAQEHIRMLEMQKVGLQDTINQLYKPDETARVSWYQSWENKEMTLPDHAKIKFALNDNPGDDTNWNQQICVRMDKREKFYSDKSKKQDYWLEVRGHSEISVHPQSSNLVLIRVTGDYS